MVSRIDNQTSFECPNPTDIVPPVGPVTEGPLDETMSYWAGNDQFDPAWLLKDKTGKNYKDLAYCDPKTVTSLWKQAHRHPEPIHQFS